MMMIIMITITIAITITIMIMIMHSSTSAEITNNHCEETEMFDSLGLSKKQPTSSRTEAVSQIEVYVLLHICFMHILTGKTKLHQ